MENPSINLTPVVNANPDKIPLCCIVSVYDCLDFILLAFFQVQLVPSLRSLLISGPTRPLPSDG